MVVSSSSSCQTVISGGHVPVGRWWEGGQGQVEEARWAGGGGWRRWVGGEEEGGHGGTRTGDGWGQQAARQKLANICVCGMETVTVASSDPISQAGSSSREGRQSCLPLPALPTCLPLPTYRLPLSLSPQCGEQTLQTAQTTAGGRGGKTKPSPLPCHHPTQRAGETLSMAARHFLRHHGINV